MGIFREWAKKRDLAESDLHNPMSTQSIGGNPFISGLHKLQKGLQGGELSGGFTGHSVAGSKFGLSPEETQEMLKRGLLARGQNGVDVNTQRLQMFLKQMPGQSPNPRIAPLAGPQVPPPPPVPGGRA